VISTISTQIIHADFPLYHEKVYTKNKTAFDSNLGLFELELIVASVALTVCQLFTAPTSLSSGLESLLNIFLMVKCPTRKKMQNIVRVIFVATFQNSFFVNILKA